MAWVECSCGKILKLKKGNKTQSSHQKRHPDHYEVRRWSYGGPHRGRAEKEVNKNGYMVK